MPMIHCGKKVPKGFIELPGAMHLGHGVWLIPMMPDPTLLKVLPQHQTPDQGGPATKNDGSGP